MDPGLPYDVLVITQSKYHQWERMSLVAAVPSIVIPIGVRSVLSLGGMITLGLGVWHVDRTWDK